MAYQDLDGDRDSVQDDELRYIEDHQTVEDEYRPPTPRPSSPLPTSLQDNANLLQNKGLPWVPKVRSKEIDSFLDHTRMKFVGFQLCNDQTSVAGLPLPIHEGLKVLKQVLYEF